jgi:hypothetical protein
MDAGSLDLRLRKALGAGFIAPSFFFCRSANAVRHAIKQPNELAHAE